MIGVRGGRTGVLAGMFAAVVGVALLAPAGVAPAAALNAPAYTVSKVSDGGFEPRIAIGPDGRRWVSTQDVTAPATEVTGGGSEVVYSSADGLGGWKRTATDPTVANPCCDNEMLVTPTGRLITSVIDFTAVAIKNAYSDDGGKTWVDSIGSALVDQDREWLAAGPKDPVTGQNDIYMLWHNLASGTANHEMFVSTSRDNGTTFLPPVSITPPGSQAYLDLQCADSGGPSNIFANPTTGDVYAVFGTRSSALGGCGASVTGPFEINVVAATRTWVSRSTDQGVTWSPSLAVDDSAAGKIVGMQVNAGALDNQGNVYVTYPESKNQYPDYSGAAVKYVWAPPDLSHWSEPNVVAQAGGVGHVLTHVVAGDPGHLAFFYMTGEAPTQAALAHATAPPPPLWYPTIAETYDGQSLTPTVTQTRVSNIAFWSGTASELMGACNPFGNNLPPPFSALNGGTNGLVCSRSSDVFGQSIDNQCRVSFVWFDSESGTGTPNKSQVGTYVATRTAGPSLGTSCPGPAAGHPVTAATPTPVAGGGGLPLTARAPAVPVVPLTGLGLALLGIAMALRRRGAED